MGFITDLRTRFNIWFRKYYEQRISLPYGILRFMGNVAFIQLSPLEFVNMAAVPRAASLWLTVAGARPVLNYQAWIPDPENDTMGEWKPVKVIVERTGFQVAAGDLAEPVWETVDITDPRVSPLRDVFLGFAFYASLLAEHKKPLPIEEKKSA